MAHEWMQIGCYHGDSGLMGSILGTKFFFTQKISNLTKSEGKNILPDSVPKGLDPGDYFLTLIQRMEHEGWEVYRMDMNSIAPPWHAILRRQLV